MTESSCPVIILVGAGHAHLHIASKASEYTALGARLILIDPGKFWYSGMATGLLGGDYSPEDDQVDPGTLVRKHGGKFIQDHVSAVDVKSRVLTLGSGQRLKYDWLSLNIGSEVDTGDLGAPKNGPAVWPVKPIPPLYDLRTTLEKAMRDTTRMPQIVVVGGGPTGSELAANLAGLAQRNGIRPSVILVSSSNRLLPDAPAGASRAMSRVLEGYPIEVRTNTRVERITEKGVVLDNGECLACDHILAAIGLKAKGLTRELGLSASGSGLRVNAHMQSVDDPRVFAAGDCADFSLRELPKLGVFGVKAAQVIHDNLLASIKDEPLKSYKPQRVWLAILNLGDSRGLLTWYRFWWLGRSCYWLKDWIDRRFMARYQT